MEPKPGKWALQTGPGYQKENINIYQKENFLYPTQKNLNWYQKQKTLSQRAAPATANRLGSAARCESGCADFVAGATL